MARKSFTELLADLGVLFPDNNTKQISALDLRLYFTNFLNAIRPAYATLARTAGVAQSVTTTDAPLVFTSSDVTSSNGEMTADAAVGRISRVDKGTTSFTFTADLLEASNSTRTVTFTLYRGVVSTGWAQSVTLTSNVQTESVTFSMIVYDPAATNYSMQVKSSANETITFSNMALIASIDPVNSY